MKKLTTFGLVYHVTKKNIYYTSSKNEEMSGYTKIMKIKWDGTGKKTIKKIKGSILPDKITSKYCKYWKGGHKYKYTYKTKKTKKLS